MHDSAKYLIHADIRASGVVERSDVVGAVFGQTEGLLGDELDLRDLQESGKLGRIDVEITSERGSSFGEITIASGLDRVETAILAAGLESIERVGPCRADVEVSDIEDVRSAKRREVVERAKELLAEFDERTLSSEDLVAEVRKSVRIADITDFHGMPAGPRVADTDAVIVVEGRSDVQTLLSFGIKNAIAVEGTDVPEEVAELTRNRTVTAFLDGDRGGDLILKELAQVGDIDHVALAPTGRSVEDLSRDEVMSALRDKVPFEAVPDDDAAELAATDGSTRPAPQGPGEDGPEHPGEDGPEHPGETGPEHPGETGPEHPGETGPEQPEPTAADPVPGPPESEADGGSAAAADPGSRLPPTEGTVDDDSERGAEATDTADAASAGDGTEVEADTTEVEADAERTADGDAAEAAGEVDDEATATDDGSDGRATTLAGHVSEVIQANGGTVRLLDADHELLAEGAAGEAFDLVESADLVPTSVVIDADVSQRVLDVAAQRGVEQVVARGDGEYVKQPTNVRVRLAAEFED